jgi:2-polyprenyl-6-hydroxyphenyl methylase/3-demethylubiquinone-9 3-methyltransferase
MSTTEQHLRFQFGRNWDRFNKRNFSEERLSIAQRRILEFTGRQSLDGFDFLDIGCGSGIHSYGALRAGARRVFSFDYDVNSVAATKWLQSHAHMPLNWTVEQGDILDDSYVGRLGKWNFVYSWGVLHHTGDMWRAVRNAQRTVGEDGFFFIALYSADVQPMREFWLDVKREYNRAGPLKRQYMVLWYIWRFGMGKRFRHLPDVVRQILDYRFSRGMNYFTDVRDWLGGWPMEFANDQDVVDLLEGEYDFKLINVKTGEACSEFLFQRSGAPAKRSVVTEFRTR